MRVIAAAILAMLISGCAGQQPSATNGREVQEGASLTNVDIQEIQSMFSNAFDRANQEAKIDSIQGMFSDAMATSNEQSENSANDGN